MEYRKINTFRDLEAWKEGHKLVLMIYGATRSFPKEEMFGLTSQMRRAAVSITSNISEGFTRQSYKEKVQFYSMSGGSITEIQNQLDISKDVGYLPLKSYNEIGDQSVKVHKILNGLITASRLRSAKTPYSKSYILASIVLLTSIFYTPYSNFHIPTPNF